MDKVCLRLWANVSWFRWMKQHDMTCFLWRGKVCLYYGERASDKKSHLVTHDKARGQGLCLHTGGFCTGEKHLFNDQQVNNVINNMVIGIWILVTHRSSFHKGKPSIQVTLGACKCRWSHLVMLSRLVEDLDEWFPFPWGVEFVVRVKPDSQSHLRT